MQRPGIGAALTLTKARTDDPLQGVTVPVSKAPNPAAQTVSHLQQVYAELVSQLPVPDPTGGLHHQMPVLQTNQEYRAYTNARVAAWKASR
jgi:phospholipase C